MTRENLYHRNQKIDNCIIDDDDVDHMNRESSVSICDDRLYGIKENEDGWYLGTYLITFTHSKIIVCDKNYKRTAGLMSLLMKKNPQNYDA